MTTLRATDTHLGELDAMLLLNPRVTDKTPQIPQGKHQPLRLRQSVTQRRSRLQPQYFQSLLLMPAPGHPGPETGGLGAGKPTAERTCPKASSTAFRKKTGCLSTRVPVPGNLNSGNLQCFRILFHICFLLGLLLKTLLWPFP